MSLKKEDLLLSYANVHNYYFIIAFIKIIFAKYKKLVCMRQNFATQPAAIPFSENCSGLCFFTSCSVRGNLIIDIIYLMFLFFLLLN